MHEAFGQVLDKLRGWLDGFILLLPNLVVAALVAIAAGVVARIVGNTVRHAMRRFSPEGRLNELIASVATFAVLAVGIFVALGVVGADKAVVSLLAGVGIIGLALGFAFQNIASNFVSGILLLLRSPFARGSLIETKDQFGTVEDVTLRATVLRTLQGQLVYVPNIDVLQNPIVNYSAIGKRRIDLDVGVSYGDDLEKAERVALDAVNAVSGRDTSRDPDLFYQGFGDSSINFTVRFWIDFQRQTDYLSARSEAVKRIKQAFDDHDITIPFPIRTLDFGIVGGEKLAEQLDGVRARGRSAS
jgi:small conductance mechanosensitive channel